MNYYEVHIKYDSKHDFSVWYEDKTMTDPNSNDIAGLALDKGLIEPDDLGYVDYTATISKKEYDEAMKEMPKA